jgi:hypothetical protein
MRRAHSGVKLSDEHRRAIAAGSPKIRLSRRGIKMSELQKEKIRIALVEHWKKNL